MLKKILFSMIIIGGSANVFASCDTVQIPCKDGGDTALDFITDRGLFTGMVCKPCINDCGNKLEYAQARCAGGITEEALADAIANQPDNSKYKNIKATAGKLASTLAPILVL